MNISTIGDDGSILLPSKAVTWFEFLAISRLTNSDYGGWNSKSYWLERGLNRLSTEIVYKWTENSLSEKALPKPRKRDFKLERAETAARLEAEQSGTKSLMDSGINDLTENKLNAVLHTKDHWPCAWGSFLSYEVPLADESDGQLKIDLLGTGDKSLSIVELKQAKSPSNTPLMALIEALCYSIQIIRCKKNLPDKHQAFERIRIIIAAPEAYWNQWNSKKHPEWSPKMWLPTLADIIAAVNQKLPGEVKLSLEMYSLHYETKKITVKSILSK